MNKTQIINKTSVKLFIFDYGFALLIIFSVILFFWYLFWDGGFQFFYPHLHEQMILLLINIPGPHVELVTTDYMEDGYVSILNYRSYVDISLKE